MPAPAPIEALPPPEPDKDAPPRGETNWSPNPALILLFGFLAGTLLFGVSPSRAEALSFSLPKKLTTISWTDLNSHGVPTQGADWLVVDHQGRFWLEEGLVFDLYGSNGQYVKRIDSRNKFWDFYGFDSMEAWGDGNVVLLERTESRAEQSAKDNFELRSSPGARLMVLTDDGNWVTDKVLVDPLQPHSTYVLEDGQVYSVHDDGTDQLLYSLGSAPVDMVFGNYASIAFNPDRWLEHLKTLPVFHYKNQVYHDLKGIAHVDVDVKSILMGQPLVESTCPLAERNGKIYYRVVCYVKDLFVDSVFVEDSVQKKFALVNLMTADESQKVVHHHALFVDEKGNLFEGVAKKDGYRIYEWKIRI